MPQMLFAVSHKFFVVFFFRWGEHVLIGFIKFTVKLNAVDDSFFVVGITSAVLCFCVPTYR